MPEFTLPPVRAVEPETIATHLFHVKEVAPLVHCITNDVVQEITANVLLAMGASPAMVIACEEAAHFAAISSSVLINVGTPRPIRWKPCIWLPKVPFDTMFPGYWIRLQPASFPGVTK